MTDVQQHPIGSKAWSRSIRQKVKFSVSKPRLMGKVKDLRCLNGDFLALIESIERVREVRDKKPKAVDQDFSQPVQEFAVIQSASQRLYDALGNLWSCSAHSGHSASITLDRKFQPLEVDFSKSQSLPRVRFSMALASVPRVGNTLSSSIWLEIETSIGTHQGEMLQARPLSAQVAGSTRLPIAMKRNFDQSCADTVVSEDSCRGGKKVSILLPPAKEYTQSCTTSFPTPPSYLEQNAVPELCSRKNLCLHLQRFWEEDDVHGRPLCAGVLKRTETFKHLIYCRPALELTTDSVSLESVISSLPRSKSSCGIPSLQRISLALSLATAVLEFHASPWLPDTWRSQNVHFYGVDSQTLRHPGSLATPFLNIQPKSTKPFFVAPSSRDLLSPIRNNVLFGLGIIFLELGFESPMKKLYNAEELDEGRQHRFSDYLTAKRLDRDTGIPLGPRFGRVIRKCLNCDFNTGENDLQSPSLQVAFYRDVVMELAELEKLFKQLDIS